MAPRAVLPTEGQAAAEEPVGERVEARHAALLRLLVVELAVDPPLVDPLAARVEAAGDELLREGVACQQVYAVAVRAAAVRAQGDADLVLGGHEPPADTDRAPAGPDAAR